MFVFIYNAVYKFAYNFMFNMIYAKYADANGTVHGFFEGLAALSEATRKANEFGEYWATAACVIFAVIVFLVVVDIIKYVAKRYAKQAAIEA